MEYELTSEEKALVTWMVEAHARGELNERFTLAWMGYYEGAMFSQGYSGSQETVPHLEPDMLDALEEEGLLRCQGNTKSTFSTRGSKKPKIDQRERETSRR